MIYRAVETRGHMIYRAVENRGHMIYRAVETKGHMMYRAVETKGHMIYRAVETRVHMMYWAVETRGHMIYRAVERSHDISGCRDHTMDDSLKSHVICSGGSLTNTSQSGIDQNNQYHRNINIVVIIAIRQFNKP